jgi:hypothetical protein
MNSISFKLLLCLAGCQLICAAVMPNSTDSSVVATTTDDPDDLFMVCSPMRSRQQLMQLLQQSSEQLKSQLIASAAPDASTNSPSARSNPTVQTTVDKLMDVLHPGHETTTTESTAPKAEPLVSGVELVNGSVASDVQARAVADTSKPTDARQTSFVGQLIGMLPNQLQNSLTSSMSNQSLLAIKATTAAPVIVTTAAPIVMTTAAKLLQPTTSSMPVQFPTSGSNDSSPSTMAPAAAQSLAERNQTEANTDEQVKAIYEEYFGRENSPSSMNLIMDGLRSRLGLAKKPTDVVLPDVKLSQHKMHDLHEALKTSNGHVDFDQYDNDRTEHVQHVEHVKPSLVLPAVAVVKPTVAKPSLVDKLAAFARFTTEAPKLVKFPEHHLKLDTIDKSALTDKTDASSKLIESKLKEKLDRLEELKESLEEKKKLKLPLITKPTVAIPILTSTTERPSSVDYYARPSSPLPYRFQSAPTYGAAPPASSGPYVGSSSAYGNQDNYRMASAFRPPYENQRSGYVYPIYGY